MWALRHRKACLRREETGGVDPNFAANAKDVLARGKKLGLYHFAEGKDAVAEADHFYATAKPYVGKAILVLDWEASALRLGSEWVNGFVTELCAKTKVRSFIYERFADQGVQAR
jgi:lysozyme